MGHRQLVPLLVKLFKGIAHHFSGMNQLIGRIVREQLYDLRHMTSCCGGCIGCSFS
ncbi:hypothetical protein B224_2117 [Aeromonas media WS]|nr:hypothetical protein B224_2117 [Aeromonas media WS]